MVILSSHSVTDDDDPPADTGSQDGNESIVLEGETISKWPTLSAVKTLLPFRRNGARTGENYSPDDE